MPSGAAAYFLSTLLSLDTADPVPAPLVEPDPGVPPDPTVPDAPPTIPVPEPFAVTSVPFPGTATGSPDAEGEAGGAIGYSPLLASPLLAAAGGLRSWQAASATTAAAVITASDFIRHFNCVIVNSSVLLVGRA